MCCAAAERSMSERLTLIREAGFDGISTHFHSASEVAAWVDEAKGHGFVIEGQAFPRTVDELRPALELAAEHRIHHLAVQGDVRPYDVARAVPILEGWQRLAGEYGVTALIETHRGTITTDMWATREMLDRLSELPLLADLSHYVCGQEITLPVSDANEAVIDRILESAQGFHGRVASSQQVQIELGFAHHKPWVEQFLRWWERGFNKWLARARPADTLTFTCELGPAPYAISGPDGRDLSDRWEDARIMADMARELWTRVAGEIKTVR